jgi:hypothetical protein
MLFHCQGMDGQVSCNCICVIFITYDRTALLSRYMYMVQLIVFFFKKNVF